MLPDDIIYRIALGLLPGIGDIYARRLVEVTGSPEAVFKEPYRNLLKIQGIGPGLASAVRGSEPLNRAEQELAFITRHRISIAFYTDNDYPERLRECPDSPVIIYYRGDIQPSAKKVLSIVGTRNITPRGKDLCNGIVADLALKHPELVIVSGLAYGVDICAHRAALRNSVATIGVMAHGFNTLYPSAHTGVAREMLKQGALITDFVSDVKPDRQNFLKRNRIVAGISDATLLIESGVKGGAMVTAGIAASYNREVFAIPGAPGEPASSGCNLLIKSQRASLVENADDIAHFLNWTAKRIERADQSRLPLGDTPEGKIVSLLGEHGKLSSDMLGELTGIPVHQLSPTLLMLEFSGHIRSLPGNCYTLPAAIAE